MSIITKEFSNAVIYNPVDRCVYEDNPSRRLNDSYEYGERILNAKRYMEIKNDNKSTDPLKLTDVFYGKHAENANDIYSKLDTARKTQDQSLASAIITSKEYTVFQDSVLLGTNEEVIKTGVLVSIFDEISTPTLTGKWGSFANDLKWHQNIPESKSPEPSFGTAAEVTIEVPKHGGAVAITERARQVINGVDVFGRLVSQLQQKRLAAENEAVAEEIESNTTVLSGGVDFGGSTNPGDTWAAIINYFDGVNGTFDYFASKAQNYTEYLFNTRVTPTVQPIPAVGSVNEQISSAPGLPPGTLWVRDNFFDDLTKGFAFDRDAIKIFRGPSRAYTVTDPDTETEKYVTKTHFLPETVDSTLIRRIDGIQS